MDPKLSLASLVLVALHAACAAAPGDGLPPSPMPDAGPGAVEADASALPDAHAPAVLPPADGGPAASTETCNGRDDDGDGIIDNLDVERDGICDCLSIATLGSARENMGTELSAWLDGRSGGVVSLGTEPLTPAALAPFQVVIVQNVIERSYSADEVAALEAWVSAGGGLLTMTGYALPDANVNGLLAPYGVQYGSWPLLNTDYTQSLPVERWSAHPLGEGVSAVGVASAYEVTGAGEVFAEGRDPLGSWVVLGRALTHGEGKLIAWGDEWISQNSEWLTRDDYQVERLWQNMLLWLAKGEVCQVEIPVF